MDIHLRTSPPPSFRPRRTFIPRPRLAPFVTVKARVGRSRYVAFRVEPSVPRAAMTEAMPPGARLTRFDGTFGIARATHDKRDAVVAALNALAKVGGRDVKVRTLAVSGTLKAAAARLPPRAPAAQRSPRPRRDESKA